MITQVDQQMKDIQEYQGFPVSMYLDPAALKQLADFRLQSWSWDGYSEFYEQFSGAVGTARAQGISALKYIGTLGPDWHPTGYSQIIGDTRGLVERNSFELEAGRGKVPVKLENFGVRAFLIENFRLADIDDLILIHFNRLDQERIPDLGTKADSSSL